MKGSLGVTECIVHNIENTAGFIELFTHMNTFSLGSLGQGVNANAYMYIHVLKGFIANVD